MDKFDDSYSASAVKVEHNFHIPAPGSNSMTHRQPIRSFLVTSQVSLHKNDKAVSPLLWQFFPRAGKWQLCSALSVKALKQAYEY